MKGNARKIWEALFEKWNMQMVCNLVFDKNQLGKHFLQQIFWFEIFSLNEYKNCSIHASELYEDSGNNFASL